MLENVACVLVNGVNAFELGVVCEVFGLDRSDAGLPVYDFAVVAAEPAPLLVNPHMTVDTPYGMERLAQADLIAVPAGSGFLTRDFAPELLRALRDAVDRGARVLSICSGAFLLARAGLLEGRRCTTHWRYTDELAAVVPGALIEPDVLYVEDGPLITSAGTAAGIDACLAIVRKEQGAGVANEIARRMVVPPHREGGQAQFVRAPVAPAGRDDAIGEALRWMQEHIAEEASVEQLAARTHLAPRTFARRFQQETGTTPYQWLLGQRVLLAQQLLEESDLTVDAIASRTGFGNAAALRQQFVRRVGTTPQAYRRTFRGVAA
ncbi:helix-turn-helix domain-containing protein [Streptomyces sp. NPDC051940]|uniref:GlxA family transcriptional regulator n=1 Tax=Streptomyces sp. NPDC051940 TaxID=3155675 RepID=UPI00342D9B90